MNKKFTSKTFKYFEEAEKNSDSKDWFEENKELYLSAVREPFEALMAHVDKKCGRKLGDLKANGRPITAPLHRGGAKLDGEIVKNHSFVTIMEKNTSRFEWNPGIHFNFGAGKMDNLLGAGIYMTSARQLREMRRGIVEDYAKFHRILSNPKLKERFGGLAGEKYKRFPRGFDPESKEAKYLWHKQFYIDVHYTRRDVTRKDFFDLVTDDIKILMPFFTWVRSTVGVYSRQ